MMLPLIGGFCLALFFFTTLRLTIERSLTPHPRPFLFLFGFFLRMGIVMGSMTLICRSSATAWLSCLGGFMLGKILLLRRPRAEVADASRA